MGDRSRNPPPGVRPHVLVVSDDADLASFLAEGLTLAGLWTSVVASPFQALEVFRLRGFDAVLLDAAIGGFGWLELLTRLRAGSDRTAGASPRADVPIFVLAGNAAEVDPAAASHAGADGIAVAPLELDDLAAEVIDAVVRWRLANPGRPWADETALGSR